MNCSYYKSNFLCYLRKVYEGYEFGYKINTVASLPNSDNKVIDNKVHHARAPVT